MMKPMTNLVKSGRRRSGRDRLDRRLHPEARGRNDCPAAGETVPPVQQPEQYTGQQPADQSAARTVERGRLRARNRTSSSMSAIASISTSTAISCSSEVYPRIDAQVASG
jgi:hypothetical protein